MTLISETFVNFYSTFSELYKSKTKEEYVFVKGYLCNSEEETSVLLR